MKKTLLVWLLVPSALGAKPYAQTLVLQEHLGHGWSAAGAPGHSWMVTEGRIAAEGVTLTCPGSAAFLCDGKSVRVFCDTARADVSLTLPKNLQSLPVVVKTSRSP